MEATMKQFYESLSEKERRRYAGIEVLKLGRGGQQYIAHILGCSRNTVKKGAMEVSGLPRREVDKRIRKPGGGRKKYTEKWVHIDEQFLTVVQEHTAGDPMDERIIWTDLSVRAIQQKLGEMYEVWVSQPVVKKLLKRHGYRKRKAKKKQSMKQVPQRNEQFENIARLRATYEAAGQPIISLDTKKKEKLGNFYREGKLYTLEEVTTWDHDFSSFAEGVVIPHGIYDLQHNIGYVQLGTSHDTSEFACDSLRYWWLTYGRQLYPDATSLLILCDGGGSNSSRHYIFKYDLQCLADQLGIEIRIAHYPPYCSKHNPIEHRLFPHVTRACQGVIFTSVALVQALIAKTHTQTGLKTFVHTLDKVYQLGRKVCQTFKDNLPLVFDRFLPQWNYRAVPRTFIAHAQVI